MLTLHALRSPDDHNAICALDASFTTGRVYRIVPTAGSFALHEDTISPPLHKVYDMSKVVLLFPKLDYVLVAELDSRVVGVAAYAYEEPDRRGILHDLYVDAAYRGKGVGRALMDAMVARANQDHARCLWLETQDINYTAIQFYKRCGFEWCGLDLSLDVRTGAPNDETAVFFAKPLT